MKLDTMIHNVNIIVVNTLQAQLFGAFLPKYLICLHIFTCIHGKGSRGSEGGISNEKTRSSYNRRQKKRQVERNMVR